MAAGAFNVGIQCWQRHSMAVTMVDFEAVTRQQGQRGRCRHNNQIEAVAGNVHRQQQWQWQQNLRWQWWQAATVVTVSDGSGGQWQLKVDGGWRRTAAVDGGQRPRKAADNGGGRQWTAADGGRWWQTVADGGGRQ